MKKNNILFAGICVISLAFTSCAVKEEPALEAMLGEVEFYAINESRPVSKTVLQDNGDIYWEIADQIDIFCGDSRSVFKSTNNSPAAEVTFKGSLDGFVWNENNEYWAVYPSSESNTFDGNSVSLSLSDTQVAWGGTFYKTHFPSIAKTTDSNLAFYNVCGGVRFKVTESGVSQVIFKGNNNEILAGTATVAFDSEGKPIVTQVCDAKTEIILQRTGYTFTVGEWYYIVCLPTTLSGGYELTFKKESGEFTTKESTKAVEIKRSIWGELNDADSGLSYLMPDNEIWYSGLKPMTYPSFEGFGANLVSNTFNVTKGVLLFDGPVTTIPGWGCFCLPDSGDSDDWGLKSITSISIPGKVQTVCSYAIDGLPWLSSVFLTDGIETIEPNAFISCESLQVVRFPASVKSIGPNFPNCPSMLTIEVNENNAVYDSREGCKAVIETATNTLVVGIKTTVIPSSVTAIGTNAFRSNNGLTEITIPGNVSIIGEEAFAYNDNLKTLNLEQGITHIKAGAFMNCKALTSLIIPPSVNTLENSAFYGCKKLKSIYILSDTVPFSLDDSSFGQTGSCPIYVPAALVDAYKSVMPSQATRIREIVPPANEIWYTSTDRQWILINPAGLFGSATLLTNDYNSGIGRMVFDGELYSMGDKAFYNLRRLETIDLPDGIKEIGHQAFANCTALASIRFSPQLTSIQSHAFENCTALESISLPETVNSIGLSAFADCQSLASIIIPDAVTSVANASFSGCIALSYIKLPNTLQSIGASAFLNCNSLASFDTEMVGDDHRSIIINRELQAFAKAGVDTYTIPSDVESIADDVFKNCDNLTNVYLPEGLLRIGSNAFGYCTGLSSVIIPSTVVGIRNNAFVYCSGLETIYVKAETPPAIESSVFKYSECPIEVPKGAFASYKQEWAEYQDRICPHYEGVDLGLSIIWGECNLVATSPEESGDYYAWGETEPKSSYDSSSYKWSKYGGWTVFNKYVLNSDYGDVDNATEFKDYDYEDDAARVMLGGRWRTPTKVEWKELIDNCTFTWIRSYKGTGVSGALLTSTIAGYTDKCIFLPASGMGGGAGSYDVGVIGFYWSSSLHDANNRAYDVSFNSDGISRGSYERYYGLKIRPVCDK